jgi:protein-tyrosine phosphatase
MDWQAESRGLATYLVPDHMAMSPHTMAALQERGIKLNQTAGSGRQLSEDDLLSADILVAIKESEHRPLMHRQFPKWEDRVTYWDISDEDQLDPDQALPLLERKVLQLLEKCWLSERKPPQTGR